MIRKIGIGLLLCFLMASCTLGAFGPGTRGNPIRSSFREFAKVVQNAETFLITDGPIRAATRTQADKALSSLIPSGRPTQGQKFSADVFWFKTGEISTAPGIEVKLMSQKATREVGEVGVTSFGIIDSVELVFGVKVASNVPVGKYPIIVDLTNVDDSTRTGAALMSIEVVVPAPTQP
jgi:hypothetical protein